MVCEIRFRWAFCHIHRCLSFFGFYTSVWLVACSKDMHICWLQCHLPHFLIKKVEKSFSQYFDISIAYCMSDYKPAQIGYLFHLWISFYFHWKTTTSTVLLRNGVFLKRVFCSYTVLVEICITFFFMNVIALKCTQQICIIVNENLFDLLSCVPLVNSDISFVRACAW